jgi:hypothetical protein
LEAASYSNSAGPNREREREREGEKWKKNVETKKEYEGKGMCILRRTVFFLKEG